MSMLFGTAYEPRVIQVANYTPPTDHAVDIEELVDLPYLRVLATLSTFLRHDRSEMFDDNRRPLEQDPGPTGGEEGFQKICHRYINLQHPELSFSGFLLHYERDVLWLGHEADLEVLEDLSRDYGAQLNGIQNVLIEASEWDLDDSDEPLKRLEYFGGLQRIYILLDSYRFLSGHPVRTRREYESKAAELQARDQEFLRGRNWLIEYIDEEKNVYGGFLASA